MTRGLLLQTVLTAVLFAVLSWVGQPLLGGGDRSWSGAIGSEVLFAPIYLGVLAYVRRGQLQDERAVRERQERDDS